MLPHKITADSHALPHRPPMIWIDEVLEVDSQFSRCSLELKKDGLYMKEERLIASSVFELMAQAYGYALSIKNAKSGLVLKKAFLTSINAIEIDSEKIEKLQAGDVLWIENQLITEIGPFSVVHSKVILRKTQEILAAARLKLYGEVSN